MENIVQTIHGESIRTIDKVPKDAHFQMHWIVLRPDIDVTRIMVEAFNEAEDRDYLQILEVYGHDA